MSAQPDPAASPLVRVRRLRKRYGGETVLDGLDLDVPRGERLAIIGASGSGKSTLLRILMLLETIDAGRVEIGGESVFTMPRDGDEVPASDAHLRRIRRKVGMVFQQFNLFPHLSALRNVAEAPRRVSGLARGAAEERARRLLARVGLEDKADSYPAELSGGQQQRVAIARALAMEPELLLFDEVTSGLDPELVGEVLDVLRELAGHDADGEKARTMLIVTHQMNFAREIADRVVFLDGGRILEDGAPEKIFTSPESPRTLAFLKSVLEA